MNVVVKIDLPIFIYIWMHGATCVPNRDSLCMCAKFVFTCNSLFCFVSPVCCFVSLFVVVCEFV